MDIVRATEIVRTLADGVDPTTGEVLPAESVYNSPEIIRALFTLLEYINKDTAKDPLRNAGKPWTEEDEEILTRMFEHGRTRKEICNYFKRSPGAIASRLVKLGKINERDEFRRDEVIRCQFIILPPEVLRKICL